jgi:hypothetical protein
LTALTAEKGMTEINASGNLILLGSTIKSHFDNKLTGDKGIYTFGIIEERFEMILEEFKKGISSKHGPTIVIGVRLGLSKSLVF